MSINIILVMMTTYNDHMIDSMLLKISIRPLNKKNGTLQRHIVVEEAEEDDAAGRPEVVQVPRVAPGRRPARNPTKGPWDPYPFEFFKILAPLVASNSFPAVS